MDVAAWLRGLGLGQYEQAFRENNIDAEVLADLTAEDLIAHGVASVGHRRKLLGTISALQHRTSLPTSSLLDPQAAAPGAASLPEVGERRQVTVMFADLVCSTALSARLKPEEVRKILRAYQNRVAGEITRCEGHIAKFMGNGVLADFSWPGAHEDDAEGAAHASLTVAQVRDGEGQVVVLSGEPRMGKSRPGLPLPAIIRAHPLPLLLLRSPNRTICEAPTAFRGSFTSTPSEHDAGCFQVSCAFQCSRRNLLMSEKSGRMAE